MFRVNYSSPPSMPEALSGHLSRRGLQPSSDIIVNKVDARETNHKPLTIFGSAPSDTSTLLKRRRRLRRFADQRY